MIDFLIREARAVVEGQIVVIRFVVVRGPLRELISMNDH